MCMCKAAEFRCYLHILQSTAGVKCIVKIGTDAENSNPSEMFKGRTDQSTTHARISLSVLRNACAIYDVQFL